MVTLPVSPAGDDCGPSRHLRGIGLRSMYFPNGRRGNGRAGPNPPRLRDDAIEVSEVFHLKDADWAAFDEESGRRLAAGWRVLGRAYVTRESNSRDILNAVLYRPSKPERRARP